MTIDKDKEPGVTETTSAEDKRDESPERAGETKTDPAAELVAEAKRAPAAEGEMPPDLEQNPEPGSEPARIDISRITDSTTLLDIHMFVAGDDGKWLGDTELYKEMQIFIAGGFLDYKKKTDAEKLEYGKTLCARYYWQMHKATLLTGAAMVEHAIQAGTGFRIIKTLVTASGQSWEDWYVNNMGMPGRTLRTVQRYMEVSRREDVYQVKHLGLEKSLLLIRATKDFDVEDKIGLFLEKFDIAYDENSEETLDQFKSKVDAGIMVLRLGKAGVSAPFELMLRFARSRLNLNARMINELKLLKDSSERVYGYIDRICTNLKMSEPMDETEINYFNNMVQSMVKRTGEMAEKAALARRLDLETINELERKIAALKQLITSH